MSELIRTTTSEHEPDLDFTQTEFLGPGGVNLLILDNEYTRRQTATGYSRISPTPTPPLNLAAPCSFDAAASNLTDAKTRNHLDTSTDVSLAVSAAGSKDKTMKPFKCPQSNCLKAFRNKSHVQSHLLTHKDSRIHACCGCKLTFSRKHDLNRHFRSVHAVNDGKPAFLCRVCGKGFGRMDSYRRHALRCCGYVG